MPRKWRFRVSDILKAVEQLERYTKGLNARSFKGDQKTIDAVLHNLYVIGEATSHLPRSIRDKHPEVDWKRIRGFRNVLAHQYFAVRLEIVWQAATEEAQALKRPLRKILNNEPDEEA